MPQRLRVIQSEMMHVFDAHALPGGDLTETLRRRQHAAGEDVLLDEIRAAAVALELGLGNGDALHQRAAARFQLFTQHAEITRPVAFPYRLEHLDRHHMVKLSVEIAVILQPEFDTVLKARCSDAALRIFQLGRGNGDARNSATSTRGMFGKTAPATADFKNVLAGLHIESPQNVGVFRRLRISQTAREIAFKQGR